MTFISHFYKSHLVYWVAMLPWPRLRLSPSADRGVDTAVHSFIHQYTITSSASVTSEDDQPLSPSGDSTSVRSHCPFWQSSSPPVLSHYLFTHGAPGLRTGQHDLKGSFRFIFVHFLLRLQRQTASPLYWPCSSSALTAHKQGQGLQMTTCHCLSSIICSSPNPLNRCLGCHRLWGLPYGGAV